MQVGNRNVKIVSKKQNGHLLAIGKAFLTVYALTYPHTYLPTQPVITLKISLKHDYHSLTYIILAHYCKHNIATQNTP